MSTLGGPLKRSYTRKKKKKTPAPGSSATFHQIPQDLASHVRGIYTRVARRLHVDSSYVSRVARGERQSTEVEAELRRELSDIVRRVNERLASIGENAPEKKARRKANPPSRSG